MRSLQVLVAAVLLAGSCGSDDADVSSDAEDAPSSTSATSPPSDAVPDGGATAVWTIDSDDPPDPASESFTAMVTRLGCSGGETGHVLEPAVTADSGEIVVTFTVEPLPVGDYTCPGNDEVPQVVEVGEAIGQRELVDGACVSGEAASTSFCSDGPVRWRP